MNRHIRDLTRRIEALRHEQTSLIEGTGKLLAYGIDSHVPQVVARLNAIKTDARTIGRHLAILGAHREAEDARHGWAIIVTPPTGGTR